MSLKKYYKQQSPGYSVDFVGATKKRVTQSDKTQSQPSPAHESVNQITPHISPDITDDLRVLGKCINL